MTNSNLEHMSTPSLVAPVFVYYLDPGATRALAVKTLLSQWKDSTDHNKIAS